MSLRDDTAAVRPTRSPAARFDPSGDRRAIRVAGLLILAAFLTYGPGAALATSVADPIAGAAAHPGRVSLGATLMLANCAIVAGIGVLLFPAIRRYDERVAVGYVVTRLIEAVLLAVGVIAMFALVALSDADAVTDASDAAGGQTLVEMAVAVNDVAYHAAMAALGLGSVFLLRLLRRMRAIPGPLAVWGMVGYAALLVGAVLELLGVGLGLLLAIPGGLFEVTFAVWLIAKGLAPAAPATSTAGGR